MSDAAGRQAPDFDPKHRIVGAIVLVALGVIFVPMILDDGPPVEAQSAAIAEIPAKDKRIFGSFVSKITPVPSSGEIAPLEPPAAGPAVPKAAAAAPKPETKKAAAPQKGAQQRWAVRIGTFSKKENVERIVAALKEKGYDPKTAKIAIASGTVTRVWLGPYADKTEASAVRARVHQQIGQRGLIVAYE